MGETRCIILAGAPEAADLDWGEHALTEGFEAPMKRFLGEDVSATAQIQTQPSSTLHIPKWRCVPMEADAAHVPKHSPLNDESPTEFLAFSQKQDGATVRDSKQFLEHSLALLNELESSQITGPDDTTWYPSTVSMTTTTTTSSFGTVDDTDLPNSAPAPGAGLQVMGDVIDLKRIPNADHIARIQPQTMTINVIAAVISVSACRTVQLRRQAGREMDIVELLLGDETRAGFSTSFWLTPVESQQKSGDDLREQLQKLRAGDVMLLQNIALHAWKGCVYGQTLSRRFARNATNLTVLERKIARDLPRNLVAKFEAVERWSYDFVGRRDRATQRLTQAVGPGQPEALPPDTQSPVKSH